MTHEESDHEGVLNQLLKTSGEAHNQVTMLESKFPRLEARIQTLENLQTKVSNLEVHLQGWFKTIHEEIGDQVKEHTGKCMK